MHIIKLKALLDKEYISRTPLILSYSDNEGSILEVSTIFTSRENHLESDIKLTFVNVANVSIVALNFPDYMYQRYVITNSEYDCGFFEKENSDSFKEYDPLGRLNLKSYLVYGYDSHVEIVCSSFVITQNPYPANQ